MAQLRVYRSFIKKAADEGKYLIIWDDSRRYEGVFKGFDPQGEFIILTEVTIRDAGESIFSPEILIPIGAIKVVSSETEAERTRRLEEEKAKGALTETPVSSVKEIEKELLQPPQIEVKEKVKPSVEGVEQVETSEPEEAAPETIVTAKEEAVEKPELSEETKAIVEEVTTGVEKEVEAGIPPEIARKDVMPVEKRSEAEKIEGVAAGEVEKKIEKAAGVTEKPIEKKPIETAENERAKKVQARLKAISEESQKAAKSPYFSKKEEAKPAEVPKRRIDIGTLILDIIIVILAVIAVLIAVVAIFGIKLPFSF